MPVLIATLLAAKFLITPMEMSDAPAVELLGASVSRLGAAMGQRVEAAHDLAKIPVLVMPNGTSAKQTLNALVLALHASLVRNGKAFRIERTALDHRTLRQIHIAESRGYVATALEKWDRILKRADGYGDSAAQIKQARADVQQGLIDARDAHAAHRSYVPPPDLMFTSFVSPAGRLLRDILGRLGPESLTNLDPNQSRDYSNFPTDTESPLPNCSDLLAKYEKAQAILTPESSESVAKLVVNVDETGGQLDLYSVTGKRLNRVGVNYRLKAIIVNGNLPYFTPSESARWIDLDEPSRRLAATLYPPTGASERIPVGTLPEEILHPERVDPLNYEVRAGLLALPRPVGEKGFVVVLSDDMLPWTARCVKDGRLDAPVFAQMLLGDVGKFETIERSGVTVIRPKDEMVAEAGLTDRRALGEAIRRFVTAGGMGLHSWGELQLALHTDAFSKPLQEAEFGLLAKVGPHAVIQYNNHPYGEYALLAAALNQGDVIIDGSRSPFDRLIHEGIVAGWIHPTGGPTTTDLALAPSTLLAHLGDVHVRSTATEVPLVGRYDARQPEYFRGTAPAEFADAALSNYVGRLRSAPQEIRKAILQREILAPRYAVGHHLVLAADLRLNSGLDAHLDVEDMIPDRTDLGFDELPILFRDTILERARAILEIRDRQP